jgi:hypothetical protein
MEKIWIYLDGSIHCYRRGTSLLQKLVPAIDGAGAHDLSKMSGETRIYAPSMAKSMSLTRWHPIFAADNMAS